MEALNTPTIETERLLLRRFRPEDIPALFSIYSDREVNTYLPWRPLASCQEAERLFKNEYAAAYREPRGYRYAVCLKANDIPIGYVHVDPKGAHDLGYALSRPFWHQGITVEAARAVAAQAKRWPWKQMVPASPPPICRLPGPSGSASPDARSSSRHPEQWSPAIPSPRH